MLLFCGCTTSKRVVKSHVAISTDSTDTQRSSIAKISLRDLTVISVRDTVISVKGKHVADTLELAQLQPAVMPGGKPIAHTYRKDDGGLHQQVTILGDGRVVIESNIDSFSLVIQNLYSKVTTLTDSLSKTSVVSTVKSAYTSVTDTSISNTVKTILGGNAVKWVIGIIVLLVVAEILWRLIKWGKKFII